MTYMINRRICYLVLCALMSYQAVGPMGRIALTISKSPGFPIVNQVERFEKARNLLDDKRLSEAATILRQVAMSRRDGGDARPDGWTGIKDRPDKVVIVGDNNDRARP